jgi:hypothetical protein
LAIEINLVQVVTRTKLKKVCQDSRVLIRECPCQIDYFVLNQIAYLLVLLCALSSVSRGIMLEQLLVEVKRLLLCASVWLH